MAEQVLRLFVSAPGDVEAERHRVELVVDRVNTEFAGRVRIEIARSGPSDYAHNTLERRVPEAGDCDVVVAVFRGLLGGALPPEFQPLPSGEPYPSGPAYEVLSAIEVRKAGRRVPDIYVFRFPNAPSVGVDAPNRAEVEDQWNRLKGFFDRWFQTQSGQFVAAFQTYLSIDDFAGKVEDCLRRWLETRGVRPQASVWDRVLQGSPFPGLASFEADRQRVFFGRDGAIAQALARLREGQAPGRVPFLLLLGASGSGKSSLLRAGLLPRLMQPGAVPEIDLWRPAVMIPGPDPFAALADALFAAAALGPELRAGAFRTREILAKQLAGDPEVAVAPLRDALERAARSRQAEAGFDAPRPARLVLALDQAERLFEDAPPAAVTGMATLLAAMVRQGLAAVIMALRSDAYAQFQVVDALVALRDDGAALDLLPPSAAELEAIVTRPAAACVPPLALEAALAARLVADARGGDALPLLQVCLARLYAAQAGRDDGVLRTADYAGMDDAVTQTANEALAAVDATARAELPALVTGLVADVSTDPRLGTPSPAVTALDRRRFETTPARAALVEAFVTRRLLIAEGDGDRPLVRPVHEALLRIWPQAVAILRDTAGLIRIRRSLVPLIRAWSEAAPEAKAAHLDISPALMDGAQNLLARFGADLPPAMSAFIEQAGAAAAGLRDRARAEQERRVLNAEALSAARRRTAHRTLAGLAAAVVLAMLAVWQWREADAQRGRAQRSLRLSTATANSLVLDFAVTLRNTVGVPVPMIADILLSARRLQDQLIDAGEDDPDLRGSQAAALLVMSRTLAELGDTSAALAAGERARDIVQALVGRFPGSIPALAGLALCHVGVGDVQASRGDPAAASASYQASLAINDSLLKADPDDPVVTRTMSLSEQKVGLMQQRQGDLDSALASLQRSLALAERAAAATPGDTAAAETVGVSNVVLGDMQLARGDLVAAMARFHTARAINDRLVADNSDTVSFQIDRLQLFLRAGRMAALRGDLPAALQGDQDALAIAERLVGLDPTNAARRDERSDIQAAIGSVQLVQHDLAAAQASYRASQADREALAALDPGNPERQLKLALAGMAVGDVRRAAGDEADAATRYRAALALATRVADADPSSPSRRKAVDTVRAKLDDLLKATSQTP